MRALEEQVKTDGACTLPGVSIAYELFMPIMMRAVARGYVRQEHADFVANGLRFGFDLGVDVSKLRGRRLFRNYPTALEARAAVTKATRARVEQGKSLQLFPFRAEDRAMLGIYRCGAYRFLAEAGYLHQGIGLQRRCSWPWASGGTR